MLSTTKKTQERCKMIKVLKNQQEYKAAQEQLYKLVFSKETHSEKEAEEIELLKLLIETYQKEHIKLAYPTPLEAIKFRMDQMGLRQKDLAPLFGGENRASEIFNGSKELSLKMVLNLHKFLGIPFQSLIQERPKLKLENSKVKQLLKSRPISDYQKTVSHH